MQLKFVSLFGKLLNFFLKAVIQYFEVEADNEYVIRGNSIVMRCKIPSYISDFVTVDMWRDTDNNTFLSNVSNVEGAAWRKQSLLPIRISNLELFFSFINLFFLVSLLTDSGNAKL